MSPIYGSLNSSVDYVQALANGDLCIVLGFSGDVSSVRDRAREANSGIEIKYDIPKEGSVMWFMLLAIPIQAPNVDGAHRFIDYIMTPKVIADISNFSHLPNGNIAALPLLTPAMRDDPANYPPPDVRERLSVMLPDSPEQLRAVMRMWQRFKAGT